MSSNLCKAGQHMNLGDINVTCKIIKVLQIENKIFMISFVNSCTRRSEILYYQEKS